MNMNSTTAITLNDRFSMIKKPVVMPRTQNRSQVRGGRSRSRSREPRAARQRSVDLRGSHRNQALLTKLERQHKMRIALKLKNKSILTTRGRIPTNRGQIVRNNQRRATAIKRTMNPRNLARNSLTTFVPLNDAPGRMRMGRSRSRSRSRSRNLIQNIIPVQDRLGFAGGRRRMRRGGQQQQQQLTGAAQRSRSRSRVRLNRNNFRNGNQAPLRRSNSVNSRLGGNGPANIVQRQQQQARRRNRSQSRGGNAGGNKNQRQTNQLRMNRPLQGRITKRKIQPGRNPGLATVRRNPVGNAIRNAKKFKRGQAGIVKKIRGGAQQQGNAARGRGRARGQRNNNNQQGQQQQQQRRGRSRTRRGNNNRGGKGPGGKGGPVSKEQLDKQLDDYMAKASA